MAHTVFTFGFKCRDHSFVEVVAAHLEKGNLALGTLSQNPRRWDIGLEPRGADHQTELLCGGLFMLVPAARRAASLSG